MLQHTSLTPSRDFLPIDLQLHRLRTIKVWEKEPPRGSHEGGLVWISPHPSPQRISLLFVAISCKKQFSERGSGFRESNKTLSGRGFCCLLTSFLPVPEEKLGRGAASMETSRGNSKFPPLTHPANQSLPERRWEICGGKMEWPCFSFFLLAYCDYLKSFTIVES